MLFLTKHEKKYNFHIILLFNMFLIFCNISIVEHCQNWQKLKDCSFSLGVNFTKEKRRTSDQIGHDGGMERDRGYGEIGRGRWSEWSRTFSSRIASAKLWFECVTIDILRWDHYYPMYAYKFISLPFHNTRNAVANTSGHDTSNPTVHSYNPTIHTSRSHLLE